MNDKLRDDYEIRFSNNWLLETGNGSVVRAYDANGNQIQAGADVFSYDSQNRLISATVAGVTAQYGYNHQHQRVTKTLNGHTRLMLYDQAGNLLSEVDSATGQAITEYVWLDGAPLAYIEAGNTYQIHVDHLGTPQVLTDGTGQVAWQAHYTPFGRASVTSQGPTFNLRFPGQYFDAGTGLHYNWHRYYDPAIGRYITSDPIGLAGGLNTYGYVGGNPIAFIDPTGEYVWVVFGAVVGGGLNAMVQIQSGQDFDLGSFVAATATGGLGGGLGTITKGLRWGKNIIANSVGSGVIGATITAAQNKVTGSCDDVWKSAKRSAFYGGFGAIAGNLSAALGRGLSSFQAHQWWSNSTLQQRLLAVSNAIHGPAKPPVWTTVGVTGGNIAGNVISNYPGDSE